MSKKKILAVDDEPNILMSIEFILDMEGYEVHTARDGDEALEVAERVRPDLLLLDINTQNFCCREHPGNPVAILSETRTGI